MFIFFKWKYYAKLAKMALFSKGTAKKGFLRGCKSMWIECNTEGGFACLENSVRNTGELTNM
jgi:hypothetical protein